jgi:hypothetical protein
MIVQWFAWIWGLGRFGRSEQSSPPDKALRFVFSQAAIKIIDDFRHLLALVLVLIFAFVLGYSMLRAGKEAGVMQDSLQAVVANLGGLIGSIIGYYFGESAAGRTQGKKPDGAQDANQGVSSAAPTPQVQNPPSSLTPASAPPPQATPAGATE